LQRRAEPHPSVVAFSDNVDEAVVGARLDGQARMMRGEPRQDRRQRHLLGDARGADPQRAADFAALRVERLGSSGDIVEGRADSGEKACASLGQRHTARRARE